MAVTNPTTLNSGNDQPIGKAIIVTGTVHVQSADGTSIRILSLNDPVFANETIITSEDGMVSIVFDDAAGTRLDLGRLSQMVLDEDVYMAETPVEMSDVIAEVEQLQEALLSDELDPSQDIDATAAPGAGNIDPRGGVGQIARFDLTGQLGDIWWGAGTVGEQLDFVDPIIHTHELEPEPVVPEPEPEPRVRVPRVAEPEEELPPEEPPDDIPPPPNYFPSAGTYSASVDEENYADGTSPDSPQGD
ncbi:MAG: hypothetical protein ABFS19_08700, partial [Thermodesulfobacteriota bacterium]